MAAIHEHARVYFVDKNTAPCRRVPVCNRGSEQGEDGRQRGQPIAACTVPAFVLTFPATKQQGHRKMKTGLSVCVRKKEEEK